MYSWSVVLGAGLAIKPRTLPSDSEANARRATPCHPKRCGGWVYSASSLTTEKTLILKRVSRVFQRWPRSAAGSPLGDVRGASHAGPSTARDGVTGELEGGKTKAPRRSTSRSSSVEICGSRTITKIAKTERFIDASSSAIRRPLKDAPQFKAQFNPVEPVPGSRQM